MKAKDKERAEAVEALREHLNPGDTVSTILRHVSRSGMMRSICPVISSNGDGPWTPWGVVATAIGMPADRDRGGVKMGGCGMDMGFSLVYSLSSALFPSGFGCIGEKCPSNDHSNGDRDRTPHAVAEEHKPTRTEWGTDDPHAFYREKPRACAEPGCHWHRDGGYALRQRWL